MVPPESDDNLHLEIGHILFIDIVGYSKLLNDRLHAEGWSYGIAEHLTKHLRALRQETMRKLNYSLPPRAIFRLVFSV